MVEKSENRQKHLASKLRPIYCALDEFRRRRANAASDSSEEENTLHWHRKDGKRRRLGKTLMRAQNGSERARGARERARSSGRASVQKRSRSSARGVFVHALQLPAPAGREQQDRRQVR
eukprot:1698437-Pleurochrysis_carterae.AAC.3